MELKQQHIVHLVRHAGYSRLPSFTLDEPGWGQSFALGEALALEGGRGSYITHIITSKELRATQTANEAFEAIKSTGVEVKEYAAIRGDPRESARDALKEIIDALPRHADDRKEVVVVTHRRFIDNILQRSYEEPDFKNTEFHSYVMSDDGTLKEVEMSALPTHSQMIIEKLEMEKDPGRRWKLETRLVLENIIKTQEEITTQKIGEIKMLREKLKHLGCLSSFFPGEYWQRYDYDEEKEDGDPAEADRRMGIRLDLTLEAMEEAWWRQKLAREMTLLLADMEVTRNDGYFNNVTRNMRVLGSDLDCLI